MISRAVGSIPETLDRVAACLVPGGRMIFMKGPECEDEVAEARQSHAGIFRLAIDQAYAIPGTTHQRRLLVYERLEGEAPPRTRTRPTEHAASFDGPMREITSATNPSFKRMSRPAERSRHSQARRSDPGGLSHPRGGAGAVSRTGSWVVDGFRRAAPAD